MIFCEECGCCKRDVEFAAAAQGITAEAWCCEPVIVNEAHKGLTWLEIGDMMCAETMARSAAAAGMPLEGESEMERARR